MALEHYHGFLNPFPHRAVTDVMSMLKIASQYDLDRMADLAKLPHCRTGGGVFSLPTGTMRRKWKNLILSKTRSPNLASAGIPKRRRGVAGFTACCWSMKRNSTFEFETSTKQTLPRRQPHPRTVTDVVHLAKNEKILFINIGCNIVIPAHHPEQAE